MVMGRYYFTGMPSSPFKNESHKFLVIGGFPYDKANNMEVLTDSGWELLEIDLPTSAGSYGNCLMVVNDTSILYLLGHVKETEASRETFIFNSINNRWTPGPALINKRYHMGCGTIKKSATENGKIFIVLGGYDDQKSVELLDSLSGQWRPGTLGF